MKKLFVELVKLIVLVIVSPIYLLCLRLLLWVRKDDK